MLQDDLAMWTLLFSALAALFAGLALFKPVFKGIWNQWLRYRWYRTVVALREDRTHTLADLPSGIKDALLLVLHPVRRWHGRPTATENRIERFERCPFYRPKHCVYSKTLPNLQPGCNINTHCGTLQAQYDAERPHGRHNRLVRAVRNRSSKTRAERFAETTLPCSDCGKTSEKVWVKPYWSEHEGRTSPVPLMMFYMGDNRWLCPACFGVPDDLDDLLPTVD